MNAFDALLSVARREWRAVGAPERVLVAVSGGADSVGLLRVLDALSRTERLTLAAATIDHGLRADSHNDAAFVVELCERLRIPCEIRRLSLARGDENAAREARYHALYDCAKALNAPVIALAHHANDQAETVLMRLSRGAGGGGLCGMAALTGIQGTPYALWRPFLAVGQQRIRDVLCEINQTWREDTTNAGDDYFRNRIRHHVLPILESGAPGAMGSIVRAARVLSDENAFLQSLTDDFLAASASLSPCAFVDAQALDALPMALRRRAVKTLCGRMGIETDYETIEALLALKAGDKCNLPRSFHAERTQARLHILPPAVTPTPLGNIEHMPFTGETGDGKRTQSAPLCALEGASLRHRLPGDFIQPFGMAHRKTLQDYLVDQKIDRPFRDHLPLLSRGSEVLWVVGVGASERLRVIKGNQAVFCRYTGPLPTEIKEDNIPNGSNSSALSGY